MRNDRDLEMTFLQDDERARTGFTIEHCDDEPPFDLCLTLDDPARGPTRYYSFSDQGAFLNMPPWALHIDAEARAAAR